MNKKALVVFVIALAIFGIVGYGVSFAARDAASVPENAVSPHTIGEEELGLAATDLVCQANLTVQATTPALEYQDVVYYFDSADCAAAFSQDPDTYINPPENP